MAVRLAFLGPEGTYTEQAAVDYDPTAERIPFSGIPRVVRAVLSGETDEAIAPIENSMEGMVTFTVDLLIDESGLKIKNEVIVPIHHCLLGDPGTDLETVEVVYSHPQALAQCRDYLTCRLPNAERIASLSTAGAVSDMRSSRYSAVAISSRRAAEIFDANIIERDIEDIRNNRTRFVILASEDHEPTGNDRTSICFDYDLDAPGLLYDTLGEFATREINMIKIESRPNRRNPGRYVFLIDIDGHRETPPVRAALDGMQARTSMFKILGSYPRATPPD